MMYRLAYSSVSCALSHDDHMRINYLKENAQQKLRPSKLREAVHFYSSSLFVLLS